MQPILVILNVKHLEEMHQKEIAVLTFTSNEMNGFNDDG